MEQRSLGWFVLLQLCPSRPVLSFRFSQTICHSSPQSLSSDCNQKTSLSLPATTGPPLRPTADMKGLSFNSIQVISVDVLSTPPSIERAMLDELTGAPLTSPAGSVLSDSVLDATNSSFASTEFYLSSNSSILDNFAGIIAPSNSDYSWSSRLARFSGRLTPEHSWAPPLDHILVAPDTPPVISPSSAQDTGLSTSGQANTTASRQRIPLLITTQSLRWKGPVKEAHISTEVNFAHLLSVSVFIP